MSWSTGRESCATYAKPLVFVAALAPFLWLLFRALTGGSSANPIEEITLTTGIWALRFLLAHARDDAAAPADRLEPVIQSGGCSGCSRSSTPACTSSRTSSSTRARLRVILADIAKRPYITAGMTAFVLMIPLALTSTKGWIRRLGPQVAAAAPARVYQRRRRLLALHLEGQGRWWASRSTMRSFSQRCWRFV